MPFWRGSFVQRSPKRLFSASFSLMSERTKVWQRQLGQIVMMNGFFVRLFPHVRQRLRVDLLLGCRVRASNAANLFAFLKLKSSQEEQQQQQLDLNLRSNFSTYRPWRPLNACKCFSVVFFKLAAVTSQNQQGVGELANKSITRRKESSNQEIVQV